MLSKPKSTASSSDIDFDAILSAFSGIQRNAAVPATMFMHPKTYMDLKRMQSPPLPCELDWDYDNVQCY